MDLSGELGGWQRGKVEPGKAVTCGKVHFQP